MEWQPVCCTTRGHTMRLHGKVLVLPSLTCLYLISGCERFPSGSTEGGVGTGERQQRLEKLVVGVDHDIGDPGWGMKDDGSGVIRLTDNDIPGRLVEPRPDEIANRDSKLALVKGQEHAGAPWDPASVLLAKASAAAPGEMVEALVHLPPLAFDWGLIRRAETDEEREFAIAARKQQVSEAADEIKGRLSAIGGEIVSQFWLVPDLVVRLPAAQVATLISWDGISAEDNEAPKIQHTTAYGGYETRNGTRASALLSNGYTGEQGNRVSPTSRVRIGVLDDVPKGMANHPGFSKVSGIYLLPNRSWKSCTSTTCASQSIPIVDDSSHGDFVARVAGGSIDDGQDSNITNSTQRASRSGVASRAQLHMYSTDGTCGSFTNALQQAVADNNDVLNHSYEWLTGYCDRTYNPCGIKEALTASTNSGVLHTLAAGNHYNNSGCVTSVPAIFRSGLTVGAMDSRNNANSYDSLQMAWFTSRGGMQVKMANGYSSSSTTFSLTDLSLPGCWDYTYRGTSGNYSYLVNPSGSGDCGTSFAAPALASSIALFRNALKGIGQPQTDARLVAVNMLLMGDGFSHDNNAFSSNKLDPVSGAGRLHLHYPSGANMTGPWGWYTHSFSISAGQTVAFTTAMGTSPMPSTVTQWKVASFIVDDDFENATDVDISVWNTCPVGGGAPVQLGFDSSYDNRSRIDLRGGLGGKCLEYRLTAITLPPGASKTVYVADYYHAGSTADH